MNYKQQINADFISAVDKLIKTNVVKDYSELVDKLNWDKSSMSNVIAGRRTVPAEVYMKLKEVYNLKTESVDKVKQDAETPKIDINNPDVVAAILAIAESNKTLSESNKVIAESNKVLVESNRELVGLTKEAFQVNLEKLQKAFQSPLHPEKELPEDQKQKIPLRTRLASKSSKIASGK